MTNVCLFRLDDITPDMDWNKFYRVKAIFDKYKVRPLLGVVPDNGDAALVRGEYHEDFWEYMASLERSGWLIAQHGYRHVYETKDAGLLGLKKASEFAGLPYEVQYDKLEKGREILQKNGLNATIFMAPGHTYDRNTLKALRRLEYTCVSDGYANLPYYTKGLLFVPSRSARPRLSQGLDTICIHCNDLGERDYGELENFLEANHQHVIPFSEILDQLWYPKKTLKVRAQERRNLLLYRIRRYAAGSERLQAYLQQTWDADRGRRRRNRILGLPRLLFGGTHGRNRRRHKER